MRPTTQPLSHRILDQIFSRVARFFKKPYTRIFYVGKSYATVIVKSPEEYCFSLAFKKPRKSTHQIFIISRLPHEVPSWIGKNHGREAQADFR